MKSTRFTRRLLGVVGLVAGFAMIHGGCSSTPDTNGTGGNPSTSSATTGAGGHATTGTVGTGGAECQVAADCAGADTDCAHRTCNDHVCGSSFKPDGFPTTAQMAGDCQSEVCDGQGKSKMLADNTDVPVDPTPCTKSVCTGGVPSHPATPGGTACGPTLQLSCDGAGNCACLTDGDCGTATACTTFTCNTATNVCTTVYTGKGMGDPGGGAVGDCMKVTCDGQGGPQMVIDDADIPDDGNLCTTDVCTGGMASHPFTVAGSSCGGTLQCDDAGKCLGCTKNSNCGVDSACTTHVCQASTCVTNNAAMNVACPDDGNPCTTDACNGSGQCLHPPAALGASCGGGQLCDAGGSCTVGCVIGGTFYAANAVNPANACQVCAPGSATLAWSSQTNGSACNDSTLCTKSDICTNGTCGGTAYACAPTSCQGSSACDGNGGCTTTNLPLSTPCTDDGNLCTSDTCDGSGVCAHASLGNGTSCGAGQVCNGGNCGTGCAIGGTSYGTNAVNPANPCQVCNPGMSTSSWSSAVNGTSCSDGNACTSNDVCTAGACGGNAYTCTPTTCQASSACNGSGGCTATNKAVGTACTDDGNPCTSDSCNGAGTCAHPVAATGTVCGSGLVCNASSTCTSSCYIGGTLYSSGAANPGNPCQVCNPGASTSTWSSVGNGTACNDGNACTSSDVCSGGACAGSAYSCSPTACQSSSTCNGSGGCTVSSKANGASCPDDGNSCTSDSCNGSGTCTHPALGAGASCGAGLVCDAGASCGSGCYIGGTFYGGGAGNPGNPCQVCNPAVSTSGWSNVGNGTACNDGNSCTSGDVCTGGACGGSAYSCSPGTCQASSTCNGSGGCAVVNSGAGVACTDDGNVCTTDSCDGSGSCTHPSASNGTSCGSGLVCVYSGCIPFSQWDCVDGYGCGGGQHCCGLPQGAHGCVANNIACY